MQRSKLLLPNKTLRISRCSMICGRKQPFIDITYDCKPKVDFLSKVACRQYTYSLTHQRQGNEGDNDDNAFLLSYLDRQSKVNEDSLKNHDNHEIGNRDDKDQKLAVQKKEEEIEAKRKVLLQKANEITKSFYRICLRCTYLIRIGNENDEKNFKAREEEQKQSRIKAFEERKSMSAKERAATASASMSFEPSVDRENELSSRASYYLAFIKESFGQEVDCLTKSIPWREDEVTRFVFLMKQGEERRSWILQDYQFEDPYQNTWQDIDEKLNIWEQEANAIVRETYARNGWLLQSDVDAVNQNCDDDEDLDWDDDFANEDDDNENNTDKLEG